METYYTYVCIHLTYFTSFSTGHCVPRYVPNRLTRGKTGLLHARAHFVRFEYIISNIHEYLIYTHVPGSSQDGIWHSTGNYLIIDSAEIHTKLLNPYQTCILKSRDLAETFAETYGHISAMPTLLI